MMRSGEHGSNDHRVYFRPCELLAVCYVNDDWALYRDCKRQFGKKNRWLEHFSGVGVYAVHLGG